MTISTEPAPLSYNGDGSTVNFAITWKYFAKSHVVATLRSATGTETVWALTTNYTLTAAGVDAGGTLTAVVAPATGEKLVITLEPPNTQESSLPLGGPFPSANVEDALDLSAQRDSKFKNLLNRTFRVPVTDTQSGSSLEFPIDSDRASKFLAFDASGNPIASSGSAGVPASTFMDTVLDDTSAAAAAATLAVLPLAGGTMTGDVRLSGNAALEEARADIAMHATTMDLWAGPNVLNGTGSAVTMTDIADAPQAGARRTLIPIAATVITDGAVFDVDGDANYTTAAGDRVEFEAVTVSTFKVHITKADGTAVTATAAATQAEQETATSTTVMVTPGRQQYHPSAAKFWLKANTTGSINASYNITSINDDGTGQITATIATDFSSTNYTIHGTAVGPTDDQYTVTVTAVAAGSFTANCTNNAGTKTDPSNWMFAGFGDQ